MPFLRRHLLRGLTGLGSAAIAAACAAPPAERPHGAVRGPVAITYWKSLSGPRHDAQVKLTDDFNAAQERVRVTLEHAGEYNPAAEKLRVALASGSGIPDAMMLAVNSDLAYFARMGVLRTLDDFARHDTASRIDGIYPRLLDDGRIGTTLYQLPFARSAPVLYLNLDLLRSAGLPETAPAAWDDLLAVSQQIVRARATSATASADAGEGGPGAPTERVATAPAPFGVTTSYLELQPLLWAFGGGYSDAKLDVKIDSAASIAAVQFFADLAHRHRVADPTKAAMTEFLQGQRAFLNGTTASLTQIDSNRLFRAGVAPLPAGTNAPLAVPGSGAGLSILAPTPQTHQETAWSFLTYMTSARSTAYFAHATGYQPVRSEALALPPMQQLLAEHPGARVAQAQLERVRPIDSILSTPFAGLKIENALNKILFERANVRDTCDALAADLRQGKV